MKSSLLTAFALAATLLTASAQTPDAARAPGIEVFDFKIVRNIPDSTEEWIARGVLDGVGIGLLVHYPAGGILTIDGWRRTTLDTFTDDKGRDLFVPKERGYDERLDLDARISPDGKHALYRLRGSVKPAEDATKILLKGKLAVLTGTKKETVKGGAIKEKANVPCADWAVHFWSLDYLPGKTIASLRLPEDLERINDMIWYDADGNKLEAKLTNHSGSIASGKREIYNRWEISGKAASVDFVVWSDFKIVPIPFDLTIDIGVKKGK